jgi:hypothetical protein
LLGNHDGKSGEGRAANAGDGEELDEAFRVCAVAEELDFELELGVNVEDVARDLQRVIAELGHRLPGLSVPVLFHVPAGRLGAEVDEAHQGDGRDEGGA